MNGDTQSVRLVDELQQLEAEALCCQGRALTVAAILRSNITMLFSDTLRDVTSAGHVSEELIAEIVAKNSLLSPLPDKFCHAIQMCVTDFLRGPDPVDEVIKELQEHVGMRSRPGLCYAVFHDGKDHCYYGEMPSKVLKLRDNALFWIHLDDDECRSSGEKLDKGDRLRGKPLKMLRFLCLERNAGRDIPFSELYTYVWGSSNSRTKKQMRTSIDVAQNEINNFATDRFISDKSKNDNAKVVRIRGEDEFRVDKETPQECCIIKVFRLP